MAAQSASIVIVNFNYARFLPTAIESALSQSFDDVEVIVVDDGSSDETGGILARYAPQIAVLEQENRGQSAAYNAGFLASQGTFICFLDADDWLKPDAMRLAAGHFDKLQTAKVQWPLLEVAEDGRATGELRPRLALVGDEAFPPHQLRDVVVREGPDSYPSPPSSGNVWSRTFLEAVFPLPEPERTLGVGSASADAYLSTLAPLYGHVRTIAEPQGYYRVHGMNDYATTRIEQKLHRDLVLYELRCDALARHCRRLGLPADPASWKRHSWFYNLHLASQDIVEATTVNQTLILVDEDSWQTEGTLAGRPTLPFLERDGRYWGCPAGDQEAIAELERLRDRGAGAIVFPWSAFWWFDCYPEFYRYLRARFPCLLENERVVILDLGSSREGAETVSTSAAAHRLRDGSS